jgi:hypothetical protein
LIVKAASAGSRVPGSVATDRRTPGGVVEGGDVVPFVVAAFFVSHFERRRRGDT